MTFHKLVVDHELTNSNKEILHIAEHLLLHWAQEISIGNLTNKANYDILLKDFAAADLMNNEMGMIRIIVSGYMKGRRQDVGLY
jgi:hypothetical protein